MAHPCGRVFLERGQVVAGGTHVATRARLVIVGVFAGVTSAAVVHRLRQDDARVIVHATHEPDDLILAACSFGEIDEQPGAGAPRFSATLSNAALRLIPLAISRLLRRSSDRDQEVMHCVRVQAAHGRGHHVPFGALGQRGHQRAP